MEAEIKLSIGGMTCQHCVKNATKALQAVEGVAVVEVTLEPGAAKVSGATTGEALVAAVESAGYTAVVVAD